MSQHMDHFNWMRMQCRLAGAALLAPVVNYRWPGFPKNLTREAYNKQQLGDQWALRVAYYAPWLLDWWMKQSWLPTSTVISGTTYLPNRLDAQLRDQFISSGVANEVSFPLSGLLRPWITKAFDWILTMFFKFLRWQRRKLATQQGIHESYFRDMMVMFGKWEFDPMDLLPPSFPVHLWQGDEDGLVPVTLQRYICSRLKWIECHELSMTGHYLSAIPGFGDLVLKTLLVPPSTWWVRMRTGVGCFFSL